MTRGDIGVMLDEMGGLGVQAPHHLECKPFTIGRCGERARVGRARFSPTGRRCSALD